jgi:tRNA uridine 5-carboxymethylaminomethyl modification enzyme
LQALTVRSKDLADAGITARRDGAVQTGWALLGQSADRWPLLMQLEPKLQHISGKAQELLQTEAHYAVYVERQQKAIVLQKREENRVIPVDFDYGSVSGLSKELVGKLRAVRPRSIAHAGRIEGMTPAAIMLLISKLQQPAQTALAG